MSIYFHIRTSGSEKQSYCCTHLKRSEWNMFGFLMRQVHQRVIKHWTALQHKQRKYLKVKIYLNFLKNIQHH